MTTYRFAEIYTHRARTGTCPVCGKRVTRQKSFMHTVNPFNKNPDGTVRTPDEVRENLRSEADAWLPDFTHAKCAEVAS